MAGIIVRILIVAIVIYIIIGFFRPKKPDRTKKNSDLDLIKCEKCGAYITEIDAVKIGGKIYCSKECAR